MAMTLFFCLIRYGGIYLDSDIIVLKPISLLNNCVGMEDRGNGSALNGAVMAFQRHRYCFHALYICRIFSFSK